MTHKEKIDYMRIAAGICSFGFSYEQMDLLVSLYEEIISKGGSADIRGLSKIDVEVNKRAVVKRKKDLLDNVSTKRK